MKMWMKTVVLGLFLVLGGVACEDMGTEPNAIDDRIIRAEAALVAADGMFQDLDLVQDPGLQDFGFDGMGAGPMLSGGNGGNGGNGGQCQGMGSGGGFRCGQMARGGFTFEREVTFSDLAEIVQPDGFDKATTDGIHMVVNGEGTRETSFWTATMERSRDMWMTGLLSDAHHLNGEGHSAVHKSGNPQDGSAMTFDMTVGVVWDDVVHFQPRADHPYPESGSITRDIFVQVTKDGEIVRGRDVITVITFNGTQFVTMKVDGEPVEIDLAEKGVKGRMGFGGGNGNGGNG
jgi:hypothetical protein